MKKNNEGQVTLTSTQAAAIIEALLAHEGVRKEDRIDRVRTRETGATALPALAPLVKAWEEQQEPLARFRSELEAVAEALWALRARFNLDDGDPARASHTFAATILASIASYVSCVAEDGTWNEETFEGLRGNIERELRRGVQEGHRPITAHEAHGLTFSEWLRTAGRSDSASEYDLRAAWRAGEDPSEYRVK